MYNDDTVEVINKKRKKSRKQIIAKNIIFFHLLIINLFIVLTKINGVVELFWYMKSY
jgi:hypothetical protein